MKNPLRLLLAALTFSAIASLSYAGPGPQHWETQRRAAQFRQLKANDKLVYVCTQCKSLCEMPVASKEHAMEMCKEGAHVSCPMCKMKVKVTTKAAKDGDPEASSEVVYVNEKGEECGFFAKPNNKK
jgi:hypothetical protein